MDGVELIVGEAEKVLPAMPPGSVDAIVTSPPYADQRDYDAGELRATGRVAAQARTSNKNQSRRQRSEAPMRFAEWFIAEPLPAMAGVLSERGSLMLNLGVVLRDGEESPYADAILDGARGLGLKLLHRMVWHKPNGNTLSDPRYLRIAHEWVFWLARDVGAYRGYDEVTRTPHAAESVRRIRRAYKVDPADPRYSKRGAASHVLHPEGARPTTVFECGVGGHRGIKHSAPMPLRLARHLVALSAPAGATVLDPFSGSATTGVACRQLGRRYIGVDKRAAYMPEAEQRLTRALDEGTDDNPEQLLLLT